MRFVLICQVSLSFILFYRLGNITRFIVLMQLCFNMLIISTSAKFVVCSFYISHWIYFDSVFRTCWVESQKINDLGLTFSPPRVPLIKFVIFKHEHDVEFLPEKISKKFPFLLGLEVYNCSVKLLTRKNFANLNELIELSMPENKLEFIGRDIFADLKSLKFLGLEDNQIEYVNSKSFHQLINLEVLKLSDNKITFLDENIFEKLTNLKVISLSNNKLVEIQENLFKRNSQLKNILLSGNNIKVINSKSFNSLTILQSIDFTGNDCIRERFQNFSSLISVIDQSLLRSSKCYVKTNV